MPPVPPKPDPSTAGLARAAPPPLPPGAPAPPPRIDPAAVQRCIDIVARTAAKLQEVNARLVPLLASLQRLEAESGGWRARFSGQALEQRVFAAQARAEIDALAREGQQLHAYLREQTAVLTQPLDLAPSLGMTQQAALSRADVAGAAFGDLRALLMARQQRQRLRTSGRGPAQADPPPALAEQAPLRWLNSRSLVVGLLATTLLFGAVGAVLKLLALLYAVQAQRGGVPPLHLPWVITRTPQQAVLQALFVLAAGLALLAYQAPVLPARRRFAVGLALVLGLASVLDLGPTQRWLQVLPSTVERLVIEGRYDAAERRVQGAGLDPAMTHYLRAQIALRANAMDALQHHGPPLLALVDAPAGSRGAAEAALFEPEVIDAIDLALHRRPTAAATLHFEQMGPGQAPARRWTDPVLAMLAAAAAALSGWWLLMAWHRMAMRARTVRRVLAQLPMAAGPAERVT
jgi:hypothetical protein